MKRIKYFVTGRKGYIGNRLCELLNAPEITSCDLQDGTDFADLHNMNIQNFAHIAADATIVNRTKSAGEMFDNNAFKLITFLQNNNVTKLVFLSTGGAIYGERTEPAREEDANWEGCISAYAQSKYIAEQIIRRMHPNHVILRLGNVFGGDTSMRKGVLALDHFRNDDPIVVYGGNQTRDFVHVDVVCNAIIKAMHSDITGTFNIANGEPVKLRTLAERFAKERGVELIIKPHRGEEIVDVTLDVTKARKAGLIPLVTPVNDYTS